MNKEDFVESLKAIGGVLVLGSLTIVAAATLFTVLVWAFEIAFRLI